MKSVILTGAAGGIGMETLRKLTAQGYVTYAGYMDDWERGEIERLAQELKTESIIAVACDIRSAEEIEATVARVERDHPDLAAVIGNGGACPLAVPVEHIDFAITRDTYETNLVGNALLLQHCLPLLKRSRGRVVFVSSLWGLAAGPHLMSYTASKHALEALAACARRELGQFGIEVSVVNPGVVKHTYMVAQQHMQAGEFMRDVGMDPDAISPVRYDAGANTRIMKSRPVPDPAYNRGYVGLYWMLSRAIDPDRMKACCTAEDCARAIFKAITARRPKVRYIVGWDAKSLVFLNNILPERWTDKLINAISIR